MIAPARFILGLMFWALSVKLALAAGDLMLLGVGDNGTVACTPEFILLEDGTSFLLQEDNASKIKLETSC